MSKKISELTETIEPKESDVLPIVNESETKKVTLASIVLFLKTIFNKVYASITHTHTKSEITDFPAIPSKTSELENDSGYITDYTETDPTVPSWAKAETKPTYEYSEIKNTPTIPTTTSQLTNNSNFISSTVITAFWYGTQTEYDALGTYNETTLYLIKKE